MLTIAGFAAATGVFGEGLFARLNAGEATVPSESTDGREILNARQHHRPLAEPDRAGRRPRRPGAGRTVTAARADLLAIPGMAQVVDPLAVPGGPQLAGRGRSDRQGRERFPGLRHPGTRPAGDVQDAVAGRDPGPADRAVQPRSPQLVPGATGQVGGGTLLFDAITGQVEKDLVKGELIALPISLLVMVLVFGGFLAAGMPIVGAIASIGGALATLLGFSYLIDLDAAWSTSSRCSGWACASTTAC